MINLINRLKWFVGLVLLQVLILNKMHISGCAIPFLYIYFILKFHSRASRNELVLWGFFLGVVVDMFCNTPGMNAASLGPTLAAFPALETQIEAFAGFSNLLSFSVGIYIVIFIALPLTEKLYDILEPKIGRGPIVNEESDE